MLQKPGSCRVFSLHYLSNAADAKLSEQVGGCYPVRSRFKYVGRAKAFFDFRPPLKFFLPLQVGGFVGNKEFKRVAEHSTVVLAYLFHLLQRLGCKANNGYEAFAPPRACPAKAGTNGYFVVPNSYFKAVFCRNAFCKRVCLYLGWRQVGRFFLRHGGLCSCAFLLFAVAAMVLLAGRVMFLLFLIFGRVFASRCWCWI